MGGDFMPRPNILGGVLAVNQLNCKLVLVGDEEVVYPMLKEYRYPEGSIVVVHSEESVTMDESPTISYRTKKRSSIRVGLELLRNGEVDAFISSGNTGAVMLASHFIISKIDRVERLCLCANYPSRSGPVAILDVGSNVDCKPKHLLQFAVMGNCFSSGFFGIMSPRVGLMNIGEESSKGNSLVLESYRLLQQTNLNFVGNIEAGDLFKQECPVDVVVCDGFVGNCVLKVCEGMASFFLELLKGMVRDSYSGKLAGLLTQGYWNKVRDAFDYKKFGGVPLLGLEKLVCIGHGSSSEYDIRNAVKTSLLLLEKNLTTIISEEMKQYGCL